MKERAVCVCGSATFNIYIAIEYTEEDIFLCTECGRIYNSNALGYWSDETKKKEKVKE